jgi:hypothetical protein
MFIKDFFDNFRSDFIRGGEKKIINSRTDSVPHRQGLGHERKAGHILKPLSKSSDDGLICGFV